MNQLGLCRIAILIILSALIGACTQETKTTAPKFTGRLLLLSGEPANGANLVELTAADTRYNLSTITGGVFEAIASPDQTRLLYTTKDEIMLRDLRSGAVTDFPTSAMFLGIGHIPNAKIFEGQLDADQDGYLKTTNYVFTKVPGVYACGDVQDRRYRQAITAAGSGCMAALEVEKFLEDSGH